MAAITFQEFMLTFSGATPQQQEEALSTAVTVLKNTHAIHTEESAEPWLSLKEVTKKLGYTHYSLLSRLHVQRVGKRITPGGRLKYKMSDVMAYLDSSEARDARKRMKADRQ